MINKIGYINSIDFEKLLNELKPLSRSERNSKYWKDGISKIANVEVKEGFPIHRLDSFLCCSFHNNTAEACYSESLKIASDIEYSIRHNAELGIRLEVLFEDDKFVAFFYNRNTGTVLPKEFVSFERVKDYSDVTMDELTYRVEGANKNDYNLVNVDNKTHNQIKSDLNKAKEELDLAKQAAKEELEELRRSLREQEQALIEKQNLLLNELNNKVESMKDQIFNVEMNIFALRSALGDTFSITQVKHGKSASEDLPLVLYQKFRYMADELARASVTSDFSTRECHIINMFDKYYTELIDLFCPSEKSISFFKVTKDNKFYGYDYENDVVSEFEYFHGNQIGMVIRNGENVYLGFIDEEITLQDNLFVTQNSSNQESSVNVEDIKSIRDAKIRPMINRKHLFIIVQALLKNTTIFKGFQSESLFNNNKIIFSNADAQLRSTKYPSFREVFTKECEIKEGDFIFIDETHRGSKSEQNYWGGGYYENHRSRGYANRGRDAVIKKGLAEINIVEHERTDYFKQVDDENSLVKHFWRNIDKSEYEKLLAEGNVVEKREHYGYYVSCEREIEDWQRPRDYFGNIKTSRVNRVNLKIYRDEFMSIMWINSNYVKSWIDSKEGFGSKNYIYFIKQLKELLDFVESREESEFRLINTLIPFEKTPDNIDVVLSWKREHKVRTFTEYQAKRFVNWWKKKY